MRVNGGCGYLGVKKVLSEGQKTVNVVVLRVFSTGSSRDDRVPCKIMDMAM